MKYVKPLTENEVAKLFKSAEGDIRSLIILKSAYYLATRVSELLALEVNDIDLPNNVIVIKDKKAKQIRVIHINPELKPTLQKWIDYRQPKDDNEKSLFLSPFEKKPSETYIYNVVKRYAIKSGINRSVYIHLFRKSAITHLAEKGKTAFEIQTLSRHKSVDSLKHYVNISSKHQKEIANSLSINKVETQPQEKNTIPKQPDKPLPPPTQPKSQEKSNNGETDSYIALLKEGIITKAELIELIKADRQTHYKDNNILYG